MRNIFNTRFKDVESPQTTWLFEVTFNFVDVSSEGNVFTSIDFDKNDPDLISTKVDLPSYETKIITKKYFGSEKSFPVVRTYSGDTKLEFILRNNGEKVNRMLNNLFNKKININNGNFLHSEFSVKKMINLEVKLYGYDGKLNMKYKFHNPIITSFEHSDGLSYDSEDIVKYGIGIHYDAWEIEY